jgi:hypothetical protein
VNRISDKYLSFLDTCHIVETVHFFKYWPHSLSIKATRQKYQVFVHMSNQDLLLFSHYSIILDKQISCLCVDNQYHSVRRKAKFTSRDNATTMTKKWPGFSKSNDLQKNEVSWKQHNKNLLEFSYNILKQRNHSTILPSACKKSG